MVECIYTDSMSAISAFFVIFSDSNILIITMVILNEKLLKIKLPNVYRFGATIVMNDVKQGLLHAYIRHRRQWEFVIPGLNHLHAQLPREVQSLFNDIATSKLHSINRANAEHKLTLVMATAEKEVNNALQQAQYRMLSYVETHLSSTCTATLGCNQHGQLQPRITVPFGRGTRTLVLGTINANPSQNRRTDYIRNITTMYFEMPARKRCHIKRCN
uniref:Helitron_like_N domain-containing protein n=1 Tax=Panagrellus redivivus TaxID=6233 RepID=A0A7E4VCT8_PANRE